MAEAVKVDLLRASALGGELDDQEAQVLASIMSAESVADGDLVVAEGDSNDALFVLVDGKLAVTNVIEEKETVVYTMTKGECAGTRAFMDRSPRKATLRASGPATVYALKPSRFETLLDSHPRIVYKVLRALFRITHSNLMRMNQESQALTNYITRTHGRY
jgi:CRP-like cAMP-binding protein